MNDLEVINKTTNDISTGLSEFEQYLSYFGLPTDNVIAEPNERNTVLQLLPKFLDELPAEVKSESRYLSKFIAGSAIGLFDASLNFLWNEVVINLRKKAIVYGLDYFFDSAVGGSNRELYKDEEDLGNIKDIVLLDTCRKLELISDILYKKLCHILDMRNQIGSSHPNDYCINGYELMGWLSTCVKDVLMEDISKSALTVKQIVENIKKANKELDDSYILQIDSSLNNLSITNISNLLVILFGIFTSPTYKDNSVLKNNIIKLSKVVWEHSSDDTKYELGMKIDSYRAALDEYKTEQAELFFEKCEGKKYYSTDSKTIKLTLLCDQLINAHNGWDNFINEISFAREIMSYIHSIQDIPEIRIESLIKTFLICRIGNDVWYHNGVSEGAKPYYDSLFAMMDESSTITTIKIMLDNNFQRYLYGNNRPLQAKEIIGILKENKLLTDRLREILNYIYNYKGNITSIRLNKEFKEKCVGKVSFNN